MNKQKDLWIYFFKYLDCTTIESINSNKKILEEGEKLVLDERHLNPGEEVLYVFVAQKNNNPFDILSTAVIALTNERILIGRKRVIAGYFLDSITPDMFNDLKVLSGIIWGKIHIDYVKEFVTLSNISKNALSEIETKISSFMMEQKKKYGYKNKDLSE